MQQYASYDFAEEVAVPDGADAWFGGFQQGKEDTPREDLAEVGGYGTTRERKEDGGGEEREYVLVDPEDVTEQFTCPPPELVGCGAGC